jgi:hypothetical protein
MKEITLCCGIIFSRRCSLDLTLVITVLKNLNNFIQKAYVSKYIQIQYHHEGESYV